MCSAMFTLCQCLQWVIYDYDIAYLRCCTSCLLMETVGRCTLITGVHNEPEIKVLKVAVSFSSQVRLRRYSSCRTNYTNQEQTNTTIGARLFKSTLQFNSNAQCLSKKMTCACYSLCVKPVRTDNDWYLWTFGLVQTGVHQIFSIIHLYLATSVCSDQSLRHRAEEWQKWA